jgi:hypothetical protein
MALLAKHEFADGWCLHCGLKENENAEQYGCLQRAIPKDELMPEPKRREYAVEDAGTISARLVELEKERLPADHGDPGDCG